MSLQEYEKAFGERPSFGLWLLQLFQRTTRVLSNELLFTNTYFFRAKYMTQSGVKRDARLSADIATGKARSEATCNLPRQVQYLRIRLSATKTMGALLTFIE
jgi:hypothetical protein